MLIKLFGRTFLSRKVGSRKPSLGRLNLLPLEDRRTPAISITTLGQIYSQNFDTLPSAVANPTAITGTQPFALDALPISWTGVGTGDWFYSAVGTPARGQGTGSDTSGGLLSYGIAGTNVVTERSLGTLVSNATSTQMFGAVFTNNTGSTIQTVNLNYTGEQWRRADTAQGSLAFGFATGAGLTLASSTTSVASASLTAPQAIGANAALDGNAAANRTVFSTTITGINWQPGENLLLRWIDANETGSDSALAIDDLSLTTNAASQAQVVYVSSSFPASGAIADLDPDKAGSEAGTAGVNAFQTIAAAQTALGVSGGTVVVLSGNYTSVPALNSNVQLVVSGAVTCDTLTGAAGSSVFINSGSSLTLNTASTVTFDGDMRGGGSFIKTGTGTFVVNGTSNMTGASVISAGTLQIGDGNTTGTISGPITNNATLDFNRSDASIFSGIVSGTGTMRMIGTGTLTLTGANTIGVTTRAVSGTLALGNLLALQSSTLDLATGDTGAITFTMGGNNTYTIGGLSGSRDLGFGANSLNVGGNNTNTTYSGILTGSGGLTKSGTGILTLSGANAYTGATTFAAGTLQLGTGGSLSSSTVLTFNATSGTATFDLNNVAADITVANLVKSGAGNAVISNIAISQSLNINAGANSVLIDAGTTTVSGSGALAITTTGAFRIGDGTVATTVTMSGLGAFTVNSNVVTIGSSTASVLSTVTLAVNSTFTAPSIYIGTGIGTGNGNFNGNATVTLGSATTAFNTDMMIVGQKRSNGTIQFASIAASNGATVNINGTGGPSTRTAMLVGNYQTANTAQTPTGTINLGNAAGTLKLSTLELGLWNGTSGAANNTTERANGTLTIGGSTVNVNTVILGSFTTGTAYTAGTRSTTGTLNINGGAVTVNNGLTIGSRTGGGANTASPTATGEVNVTGGTLTVSGLLRIGNVTVPGNNATRTVGTLNVTGGVVSTNVAITTSNNVANDNTTTVTLNGGTLDTNNNAIGASGALLDTLTITSGTLRNVSQFNAGAGITKTGAGTLVLEGTNAYTGGTTISAGTLQIGTGGTTGTIAAGTTITNNGVLAINRSDSITLDNVITGTGSVVQSGTGTAILTSNASDYSGATTVVAGTLLANNSAGSATGTGTVTVNLGSTLGGTGIISGAVTLNGRLSPNTDSSTDDLRVGAPTFGAGSSLRVQLNGTTAGSQYDQLSTPGNVALGSGLAILDLTVGFTPTVGDSFTLINNTGGTTTGFFANLPTSGSIIYANGHAFSINYAGGDSNDVVLTSIALPPTKFVSPTFTLANFPDSNVPDADLVAAGNQAGVIGSTAFSTLSAALAAASAGDLIIVNAGAYSEAVNIPAGVTLLVQQDSSFDSLTGSGNLVIDGTTVLTVGDGNDTTYDGSISGTGSFVKAGTSTLSLTGAILPTGGFTTSAGAVQVGTGGTTGQLLSNATNNASIRFNRSDAATFAGSISGTGSVTILGSGTLTLAGANSYQGATSVNAGTLVVGSALALSPSSAVTVAAGATLDLNGYSATIGSLAGDTLTTGGTVTSSLAGAVTLTTGGNNSSTTFAGVIQNGSGTVNLVKVGTGTLTMVGDSTNTGSTTISGGTLQLGDGGTTGNLASSITNNGTLIFNRSDNITWSTVISGTGGLVKNGSNTLILSANNTFTGTTTVSTGTLQIGAGSNSGAIGGPATIATGATLRYFRSDGSNTVANSFSGTGTLMFSGTGATSQSSYTPSGNNSGFTGTIEINSSGLLGSNGARVITNNQSNAGSGSIVVSNNSQLSMSGTLTNPVSIVGNGWLESGQYGAIRNTNGVYAGPITLTGSAMVMSPISLSAAGSYTGPISDGGNNFTITYNGSAQTTNPTVVIAVGGGVGSTTTGPTVFTSGIMSVINTTGSATGTGPVTFNSNTNLTGTGSMSGPVTINGNVTPGTTPRGSNTTYSVPTSGRLTTGNLTINGPGNANFTTNIGAIFNILGPNAGATTNGYDQLTVNGTVTLGSNPALTLTATYTPAINETLVLIDNDGTDAIVGTFSGRPEGSVVYVNGLVYTLSYVGGTGNDVTLTRRNALYVDDGFTGSFGANVDDVDPVVTGNQAGTFGLTAFASVNAAIAAATPNTLIIVNNGTYSEAVVADKQVTLHLQQAGVTTFNSLASTVTNPLLNLTAGVTLTTHGDNTSTTFTGAINGAGAISKAGQGTLTLVGTNNTYTGATTITNGAILFNNTLPASVNSITVDANTDNTTATIGGTGTIAHPITLATPAGTARVHSITAADIGTTGTLTVQDLTLNSGAIAQFDIGSTTSYDRIVVNGALVATDAIIQIPADTPSGTYTLFTYSSGNPTFTLQSIGGGAAPSFFSLTVANGVVTLSTPSTTTQVGFTVQPASTTQYGNSVTVAVAAQENDGTTDPEFIGNATLDITGSTFFTGQTLTQPFVNGVANFTVFVNAGIGIQFLATSTGLSTATSAAFEITPVPLTITGITASNRAYNGNTTASLAGGTLAGILPGDTVFANVTGNFADKNVGTAKPITLNSITLSGASAGNYTLTQPTTSLTADITTAPLTITGISVFDKTYDGTTDLTGGESGTLNGLFSGDTVIVDTFNGAFIDKNVGTSKTIILDTITLSGADAGNYTFTQPASPTASITPAALTVTAASATKVYDGTTASSTTPTISGSIFGGDTANFLQTYDTAAPGSSKTLTPSGSVNDGNSGNNYTVTFVADTVGTITPLNPVINNYTPNTGTIAGGTEVIFNGSNLTAAAITFDGIAASFVSSGSGTITVTTPAHAAGAVDIVITTPGGSLTIANGFTYVGGGATLDSVTANGVLSTFNNATTTYGPVSLADATTSSGFYTFSRIVSLELTFSDIVHVDDGAFTLYVGDIISPTYSLTNNAAADIITLGEGTSTIQLNFANANVDGLEGTSLQNGIWKLRVDYTKIHVGTASGPAAGTQTDFEWNEQIRRLFGDANGDGNVGPGDFTAFGTVYTLQDTDPDFNPLFNSNNNSSIDPGDFTAFGTNFGQSL